MSWLSDLLGVNGPGPVPGVSQYQVTPGPAQYGTAAYNAAQGQGADWGNFNANQGNEQQLLQQLQQMGQGQGPFAAAAKAQLAQATSQAQGAAAGSAAAIGPTNLAARQGLGNQQSNLMGAEGATQAQLGAQEAQTAMGGIGSLLGTMGNQDLGQAGLQQQLQQFNAQQQNQALGMGSAQAEGQWGTQQSIGASQQNQANAMAWQQYQAQQAASNPMSFISGLGGITQSFDVLGSGTPTPGGGGGGGTSTGGAAGYGNNAQGSTNWANGTSGWDDSSGAAAAAHGAIVSHPTLMNLGEHGPEAVVPLSDPAETLRKLQTPATQLSQDQKPKGPVAPLSKEMLPALQRAVGMMGGKSPQHDVVGRNPDGTLKVKLASGQTINVHPAGIVGGLASLKLAVGGVAGCAAMDEGGVAGRPPAGRDPASLEKYPSAGGRDPSSLQAYPPSTSMHPGSMDLTNVQPPTQVAALGMGGMVGGGGGAMGNLGKVADIIAMFDQGGRTPGPTTALVGESGPEAIVPLDQGSPDGGIPGEPEGGGVPIGETGGTNPVWAAIKRLGVDATAPIPQVLPVGAIGTNPDGSPMMAGGTQAAPIVPSVSEPRAPIASTPARVVPAVRPRGAAPFEPDPSALANSDIMMAKQESAQGQAEATESMGKGIADSAKAAQDAAVARQADVAAMNAKRQAYANDAQARMDRVNQEIMGGVHRQGINDYFANKSTPGKIAAGIGLGLGTIGTAMQNFANPFLGKPGVTVKNQAAEVIKNAIQDDVDQQRANLLLKGQGLEGMKSTYGLHMQALGDADAASAATYATHLDQVNRTIDQYKAQNISDQARAGLSGVQADLVKDKMSADNAAKAFATQQKMAGLQAAEAGQHLQLGSMDIKQRKMMMDAMEKNPGAFGNPANVVIDPETGQKTNGGIGVEGEAATKELAAAFDEYKSNKEAREFNEQHGSLWHNAIPLGATQGIGDELRFENAEKAGKGSARMTRMEEEHIPNAASGWASDRDKLIKNEDDARKRYLMARQKAGLSTGG